MVAQPIVVKSAPAVERDSSRLNAQGYTDALWSRMDNGRPRKMRGYRQINHQLSDVSRGIGSFSRAGYTYVHSAGQSKLEQITLDSYGTSAGIVDRTPTLLAADPSLDWKFDTMFDPASFNDAMVIAHGGLNLASIDNAVETPVFWGKASSLSSLVPMALPINVNATTVLTTTGTTSSGSATITAIPTTAALTYGMTVTGTGIPAATYIMSVDSGTQVTLSNNATATGTGVAIKVQVGGTSGGVVTLFPYLMIYGSNGYVLWNHLGNPNDFWTNFGGGGANSAYVTDQKIVRGLVTRAGPGYSPSGLFWSLNSLVRALYQGGNAVFGFDTISDTISVLSPRSIIEVDGGYFWAGVDRFFMYAGSVREIPNPYNQNWFFDGMNWPQRMKAFAFYNARWGEIWFCYPRGTATECSHAAIFNVRQNTWYDTQLPNGGRSAGISSGVFPYPLMAGVDPYTTSPNKYRLWQQEFGLDEIDGPSTRPIRSYFRTAAVSLTTAPQQAADKETRLVKIEPDLAQIGDMSVTVLKSSNARGPLVPAMTKTILANPANPLQEMVDLKITGRQLYLQFESNTLGGDYQLNKSLLHVEAGDGRETM